VAFREEYTEGSGTAKAGTEEHELHKRLVKEGKVTQHTNAYKQRFLASRCSSDWPKDKALTRGGLGRYGLPSEKSADSIVVVGNEPGER